MAWGVKSRIHDQFLSKAKSKNTPAKENVFLQLSLESFDGFLCCGKIFLKHAICANWYIPFACLKWGSLILCTNCKLGSHYQSRLTDSSADNVSGAKPGTGGKVGCKVTNTLYAWCWRNREKWHNYAALYLPLGVFVHLEIKCFFSCAFCDSSGFFLCVDFPWQLIFCLSPPSYFPH